MFSYEGPIESSKSWANRASIIQYYQPNIEIEIHSNADDVLFLQKAIEDLSQNKSEFNLGHGGTTLRFFSFLIARKVGEFTLKAEPRLLERPQQDLISILKQLKVEVICNKDSLVLRSQGWILPKTVVCEGDTSSQFISGLLLNSWELPGDLVLEVKRPLVSEDYLHMTIKILQESGLEIQISKTEETLKLIVKKNQKPKTEKLFSELDLSSAFALASAAVINGDVKITNWNSKSTQPDFAFLAAFNKMNITFETTKQQFTIRKHKSWNGIDLNLKNSPDLFPVLAVLCSLAKGSSYLFGAGHLISKESNRIKKTNQLLQLCGFECTSETDGIRIVGESSKQARSTPRIFDPDQDHRMAMAAGLLKLAGFNLKILNPEVVNKSYPTFWSDIQVIP